MQSWRTNCFEPLSLSHETSPKAQVGAPQSMEAAAALDTMRVMKLIAEPKYQRGIELLEGIVAMLTKMT